MIPVRGFEGKRVAVFGLGRTGLTAARLNAALREHGEKYSAFIKKMADKKVEVDRKVLSEMANKFPNQFDKFVEKVK